MPAEQLSWISATGEVVDLTSGWCRVAKGPRGRLMPPESHTNRRRVSRAGSQRTVTRHEAREVSLAVHVLGDNETDCRLKVRQLARALDPVNGPGILRSTLDGAVRDLECYYVGGFEGDETTAGVDHAVLAMVLDFEAPDPYWFGETVTRTLQASGAPTPFSDAVAFDAALPFSGSLTGVGTTAFDAALGIDSSTAFDGGVITVFSIDSDVDVWPTITVTGPCSSLVITNLDRSVRIGLEGGLKNEKLQLIIDGPGRRVLYGSPTGYTINLGGDRLGQPRQGRRTIVVPAGFVAAWGLLSPGSRLFPFEPGDNRIALAMTGTTSASQIDISWKPRWLTA